MSVVSTSDALQNAREILSHPNLSTEAITHLRKSIVNGCMIGRHFDRCFIGLLAEGSGYQFPTPPTLFDPSVLDMLDGFKSFAASIGIEVQLGLAFNPIEKFCMDIAAGDTPENSWRARMIAEWCDDELERRRSQNTFNNALWPAGHEREGELVGASS